MTGAIHSAFQNFRSSVKVIPINLLVAGAGGIDYYSGGQGGNAGRGGTVYDNSNRIEVNSNYTITVGSSSATYGERVWNGSSWVDTAGGNGGASSVSGKFGLDTGLYADGGLGTGSVGGGSGGAGLNTYSLTPSVYSEINGTGANYGGGGSGGTYRTYLGGAGAGLDGTGYGQASWGGNGGNIAFGASGVGARGGRAASGVVIMRCKQSDYTSYTATGATVTTITVSSIVYTVFTWTTGGSITFT